MKSKSGKDRIFLVGIIFTIVFGLTVASAAQQPGTLTGTVLGPDGAIVPNTEVEVRWNDVSHVTNKGMRPRRRSIIITADMAGQYSIQLPPGNWDVFAYHDGFAPACTLALIDKGKTTTTDLRLTKYAPMSLQ
jgi:Carboxypeptidase regulatory-like domain